MKYNLALLILSALPLAACGGNLEDNQSAANNQLEAADNVMWNDLANVSLENEANAASPPSAATETDAEARPAARSSTGPTPTEGARPAPAVRDPSPVPKVKPAPTPAPTPEPSSPPQETCAPEHRAAGHC